MDQDHEDELQRATLAVGGAENAFHSAADRIEAFLTKGMSGVQHPRIAFPTQYLLARSLADLRAAMFLAATGFIIQSASVMRPAVEAINLIELFAQDESYAEAWLEGTKNPPPPEVRKALGKSDDRVYAYLATLSHPRVVGAEHTTYTAAATGDVILMMGGLPLNDPKVLIAAALPGDLLTELAHAAGHASISAEAAKGWPTLLVDVTTALLPGAHGIFEVLHPNGIPNDSPAAQIIETMTDNIRVAQELAAAVAEAGP